MLVSALPPHLGPCFLHLRWGTSEALAPRAVAPVVTALLELSPPGKHALSDDQGEDGPRSQGGRVGTGVGDVEGEPQGLVFPSGACGPVCVSSFVCNPGLTVLFSFAKKRKGAAEKKVFVKNEAHALSACLLSCPPVTRVTTQPEQELLRFAWKELGFHSALGFHSLFSVQAPLLSPWGHCWSGAQSLESFGAPAPQGALPQLT